jgi:hypothetical protein
VIAKQPHAIHLPVVGYDDAGIAPYVDDLEGIEKADAMKVPAFCRQSPRAGLQASSTTAGRVAAIMMRAVGDCR